MSTAAATTKTNLFELLGTPVPETAVTHARTAVTASGETFDDRGASIDDHTSTLILQAAEDRIYQLGLSPQTSN